MVVLTGWVRHPDEVGLLVELVQGVDGVVDVMAGGLLVDDRDEMGG